MNRFTATESTERQLLFGDAIRAHRERESPFLTVEAARDVTPDDELPSNDVDVDAEEDGSDAEETTAHGPPWVQFADGTINVDCTEAELDRLKELVGEFPAFKISDLTRPEEAEGVNANVSALADAKRIAEFIDRTFRDVYGQPDDYQAWVVAV